MAIEIRELVIRATVNEQESRPDTASPDDTARLREEILAECTDKIVEILRQQKER